VVLKQVLPATPLTNKQASTKHHTQPLDETLAVPIAREAIFILTQETKYPEREDHTGNLYLEPSDKPNHNDSKAINLRLQEPSDEDLQRVILAAYHPFPSSLSKQKSDGTNRASVSENEIYPKS